MLCRPYQVKIAKLYYILLIIVDCHMVYCTQCGAEVARENSFCEECGTEVSPTQSGTEGKHSDKDRTVAIALAIFFGLFGIHRFYVGQVKMGLLYLVGSTTGLTIILGFYDAYKYYSNQSAFQ